MTAEPHELEERVTEMLQIMLELDSVGRRTPPKDIARSILALVRQEQESVPLDAFALRAGTMTVPTWDDHVSARKWGAMIRAWWLSHTAPQEK